MTTRHAIRMLAVVSGLGAVGCGPSPPAEPCPETPALVVPKADAGGSGQPADTKPTTTPDPDKSTKPADPPPGRPSDTGGKAVARALRAPSPLPADPPRVTPPKPYASALDRGEFPLPKVRPRAFVPTDPKAGGTKPSVPAERNQPADVTGTLPEGKAADRPLLKMPSTPNPGAADVPANAWRQGDRASLDDPTVDLSAMRVIETALPVATGVLPFVRVSIPDPFDLTEQLKGKLGKDTELGTGPVK
jgi:hypothetical protein